jgi:serine/threonine-protein kinase
VGRVLADRYRILARIGEGGMGTVYLAEHVLLGKRMAVKVLRPEYSHDDELARRFEHEAVAASRIGQENIVDVTDFGRTADGDLYFVMEALEGENLATLARREGALPLRRALGILAQICRALAAAHARGIVHRDLKPENVFLAQREDGSDLVKVLDFGISLTGGSPSGSRITRAGSIIGTPEYMAPEQAAATRVDHRCDIYAFGVLAYEILTGSLPFQGDTPIATLIKHQGEAPTPPRRRRPELPLEVEALILKALVKKPEGRPQSMAEVAAGLSRALAGVGLPPVVLSPTNGKGTDRFIRPALLVSPSARGETLALDAEDTQPALPAAAPAAPRRRSRLLVAAGLTAAALAGAAAMAILPRLAARESTPAPVAQAPAAPSPRPATSAQAATPTAISIPAASDAPRPAELVHVTLRTIPSGAQVYQAKERLGVTPLQVLLPAGGGADYRFALPGHRAVWQHVLASDGEVEVRLGRLAARWKSGREPAPEENPYGKVEDLKDPYR